mmetsp:Transcript_90386/g.235292  ORF Transcript_90386/g.235292 Transcript_90386/m.235292 type:complete len:90 (-) Transcript_90386:38-307(-)
MTYAVASSTVKKSLLEKADWTSTTTIRAKKHTGIAVIDRATSSQHREPSRYRLDGLGRSLGVYWPVPLQWKHELAMRRQRTVDARAGQL